MRKSTAKTAADTLAKAIRGLMPSAAALRVLDREERAMFRARYALPLRKQPLDTGGHSALHEFLARYDTSRLERPGLEFEQLTARDSELHFASWEADRLIVDETGVFVVEHETENRLKIARDGDAFVKAMTRLARAEAEQDTWAGRFSELLELVLLDAGVKNSDRTMWRGVIPLSIARSSREALGLETEKSSPSPRPSPRVRRRRRAAVSSARRS